MDVALHQTTLVDVVQVAGRCGTSRSQIYKLVTKGMFPEPVVRAPRFTRWKSTDVEAWVQDPAAWLNKKEAV